VRSKTVGNLKQAIATRRNKSFKQKLKEPNSPKKKAVFKEMNQLRHCHESKL
jgi:hypothetical protein